MKKLLLLSLAFCLIGGTAFTQISFGPKAGLIFAKYGQNYKDSDDEDYLQFRTGPSIGAVMDMTILDFLSFQPSVLFSIKGTSHDLKKWSDKHANRSREGYDRDRVMYLEIPLNFAGKLELGPGVAQIFVGPYIAFALGGRNYYDYKETTVGGGTTTEKGDTKILMTGTVTQEDIDTDGVGGYMRPFDFGFDFGLGYQWKAFLFNIGYNLGIANLTPNVDAAVLDGQPYDPKDFKNTNQGIFFNVAWLFEMD